jgi:hypothetical protein
MIFLAGAGCGGSAAEHARQERHAAPACLERVWARQERPDRGFDARNDPRGGDSISCATLTSAGPFDRFLRKVRSASASGDRDALLALADYPLVFIDARGTMRSLTREAANMQAAEVFNDRVLAALGRATLADMQVVRNKGAYFAAGALWLYVPEEGGDPRIGTINHQALAQADPVAALVAGRLDLDRQTVIAEGTLKSHHGLYTFMAAGGTCASGCWCGTASASRCAGSKDSGSSFREPSSRRVAAGRACAMNTCAVRQSCRTYRSG